MYLRPLFGNTSLAQSSSKLLRAAAQGEITADDFPGLLYKEFWAENGSDTISIQDWNRFITLSYKGTSLSPSSPHVQMILSPEREIIKILASEEHFKSIDLTDPESRDAATAFMREFINTRKRMAIAATEAIRQMQKEGFGLRYLAQAQETFPTSGGHFRRLGTVLKKRLGQFWKA